MAGLQRSAVSFRRQGSSGLIWDDRFFSGELKPTKRRYDEEQSQHDDDVSQSRELRPSRSVGSSSAHRMSVISSSPPTSSAGSSSPKFTGCGFCGVFGRPIGGARQQKSINRRSE